MNRGKCAELSDTDTHSNTLRVLGSVWALALEAGVRGMQAVTIPYQTVSLTQMKTLLFRLNIGQVSLSEYCEYHDR